MCKIAWIDNVASGTGTASRRSRSLEPALVVQTSPFRPAAVSEGRSTHVLSTSHFQQMALGGGPAPPPLFLFFLIFVNFKRLANDFGTDSILAFISVKTFGIYHQRILTESGLVLEWADADTPLSEPREVAVAVSRHMPRHFKEIMSSFSNPTPQKFEKFKKYVHFPESRLWKWRLRIRALCFLTCKWGIMFTFFTGFL